MHWVLLYCHTWVLMSPRLQRWAIKGTALPLGTSPDYSPSKDIDVSAPRKSGFWVHPFRFGSVNSCLEIRSPGSAPAAAAAARGGGRSGDRGHSAFPAEIGTKGEG